MADRRQTTRRAHWTREQYLEDSLARHLQVARRALQPQEASTARGEHYIKPPHYTAALVAMKQADTIRHELDQHRAQLRDYQAPADPAEHMAAIYDDLRRLRGAAEAGGSYVAASNLLRLEHDLVAAELERQRNAEDVPPDVAAVMERLELVLDKLPPVLRMQLGPVLAPLLATAGTTPEA